MKITVIGAAGRMGSMRARHLIEMGHKVCGVDLNCPPEGGPAAIEWCHGIADDSSAVVIATPADRHLYDLQRAFDRGCHIFVEKPLCLIGQCDRAREILKSADKKGLVVTTGYNLRFHPLVMQAKRMIESGEFKPLWGSFLLRQKPARPIAHFLEEWASHEVDMALHLFGPADRERLIESRRFTRGPNYMQALIQHADIDIRWKFNIPPRSFIHADEGTPEPFRRAFTLVDQNGDVLTYDIEKNHVQPEHYKAEIAAWIEQVEDAIENARTGENNPLSPAPLATGWDGLAVIELLEQLAK